MRALTRDDIVAGLRALGLQPGDKVLVHSSVAALGRVEGGPDAVIDALLAAVGPAGLVMVPTFATARPFDRRTASTPLGAIPDAFRRRPGAVRSKHPTHSVAAIGAGAAELIRDHEKVPTAYAEGTPYYRLAEVGGKILLLGVDQDRNTTLHAAEAIAGSPYLTHVTATYVDDDGREVTIPVAAMAGPHRNFIGLDRLFRERGVVRVGRIGSAVCRLMDARRMLDVAIEALRADPAAVLCDNPACADCVLQRGAIKAARLREEAFTLAAVAGDISDNLAEIEFALRGEGIAALELTPDEHDKFGAALADAGITVAAIRSAGGADGAARARRLGVPLIVPAGTREEIEAAASLRATGCTVYVENVGLPSAHYAELLAEVTGAPPLALNPGRFAAAREKPFLQVFYRGPLRKRLAHFYVDDATWDGAPALPGRGNGEVKEILSMLRCRSYSGIVTLRSHVRGVPAFREAAAAFWGLLDTM
ncbi:MAG: AAC(3) family N-acetyltransferase [Armatimonadetes bacterium]|nr:AAC(3) family N-acetyltransferase [Armatimonadota bacterium]